MVACYQADVFATLEKLRVRLLGEAAPVVLLEGTRQLPDVERPSLIALARRLATVLPATIFRTGNATGADTAFAEGVVAVDAKRLQYVLPNAGMGRQRRQTDSLAVALGAVPAGTEQVLASATTKASPASQRLVDLYVREKGGSANAAKGAYLMRDTLKVLGCAELNLTPATVGIFYVNESDPLGGGTGHTICVCIEHGVPVVTQKHWRNWLLQSETNQKGAGHGS